jgi:hypothetical protein
MRVAGGLLLLLAAAAAAQSPGDAPVPPVTYPVIAQRAPALTGFVPQGWLLETQALGDLNGDKLPDAALVLRMNDPANLVPSDWDPDQKYDSNPRMLLVLLADRGGAYTLAASDHALIPRIENQNQDDPFDGVAIANGALKVKLRLFMSAGGWRMGEAAFTLRWQDGAMRLIGYDANWVERNSGKVEEVSINYLTGRKLLKTGTIESDSAQTMATRVATRAPLTLAQLGDGLMFDPDEH